ncbi:MAG: glycosyltransferase, partial [Vicinamibacteria bacterium]
DGIRELIADGETGWRVPAGDVDALSRAINEALDDPDRAAHVGRVVDTLAEVRGVTRAALVETMRGNFERLFRP